MQLVSLHTPWKNEKASGYMVFSKFSDVFSGYKMENQAKIG